MISEACYAVVLRCVIVLPYQPTATTFSDISRPWSAGAVCSLGTQLIALFAIQLATDHNNDH